VFVDPYELIEKVRTDATSKANARIIVDEFNAAGMPPAVTLAALVNAYAESAWNARAWGDNNQSGGLFQLNMKAGAGKGMTRAQIEDPRMNTRRIIQEVRAYGRQMMAAVQAGEPVRWIVALFARDIERPRDRAFAMQARQARMYTMFGAEVADAPASAIMFNVYMGPPLPDNWQPPVAAPRASSAVLPLQVTAVVVIFAAAIALIRR